MSLIVPIATSPDFAPELSEVAPDRQIEGHPRYKTWLLDEAKDGLVETGIWQATPGTAKSIKGETFEFCHILEGVAEITDAEGQVFTFRAGDSFLMKPGFVGQWKTIETVKKIFLTVG